MDLKCDTSGGACDATLGERARRPCCVFLSSTCCLAEWKSRNKKTRKKASKCVTPIKNTKVSVSFSRKKILTSFVFSWFRVKKSVSCENVVSFVLLKSFNSKKCSSFQIVVKINLFCFKSVFIRDRCYKTFWTCNWRSGKTVGKPFQWGKAGAYLRGALVRCPTL